MRIRSRDLIERPLSVLLFAALAACIVFAMRATRIELEAQPRGSPLTTTVVKGRVVRRDVSHRGVEWMVSSNGHRMHLSGIPRFVGGDAFPGDDVEIEAVGRPADLGSPYERHLFTARQADWVGRVVEVRATRPPAEPVAGAVREIHRMIARMRDAMVALVEDTLPPPHDAMVLQLTIGYRARETAGVAERFRDAGVIHVLVVSGLHVALVYALIDVLVRFLPVPYTVRIPIGIVFVWVYALLAGLTPPVTRAAFMVTCLAAARLSGRDYASLHALAFAAVVILIENHRALYSTSFQLSFGACLGLILFFSVLHRAAKPLLDRASRPAAYAADLLLATVSAQVFTIPLVMLHFYRISPVGFIANLFAVPLGTLLLWCGFALYLALVAPVLTGPLAAAAHGVSQVLVGGMELLAKLPCASVVVPAPAGWAIVGYGILALASRAALGRGRWWVSAGMMVIAALVLGLGTRTRGVRSAVSFLPVGLGDAVVVHAADGTACMVDCGGEPRDAEQVIAPYLLRGGVRELSAVVITHAHINHYGALEELSRMIPVRRLYMSDFAADAPGYRAMLARMVRTGTRITVVSRPTDVPLGDGMLRLVPLWDDTETDELAARDSNALVALLNLGGATCLFSADVPLECTVPVAAQHDFTGRWDILLIPRHGRNAADTHHPACRSARVRVVSSDARAAGLHRGAAVGTTDGVISVSIRPGSATAHRDTEGWRIHIPAASLGSHGTPSR
jgi:DNA internalization-related competence protein ComEC/Rec2